MKVPAGQKLFDLTVHAVESRNINFLRLASCSVDQDQNGYEGKREESEPDHALNLQAGRIVVKLADAARLKREDNAWVIVKDVKILLKNKDLCCASLRSLRRVPRQRRGESPHDDGKTSQP